MQPQPLGLIARQHPVHLFVGAPRKVQRRGDIWRQRTCLSVREPPRDDVDFTAAAWRSIEADHVHGQVRERSSTRRWKRSSYRTRPERGTSLLLHNLHELPITRCCE
jgi:hypothetical protein